MGIAKEVMVIMHITKDLTKDMDKADMDIMITLNKDLEDNIIIDMKSMEGMIKEDTQKIDLMEEDILIGMM